MLILITSSLIYGGNMFDKFLKKLKRTEINKWYVVLAVVLAVVFRFWGENSITMLQKDVPIVTDTEISQAEFESYLQTKPAYLADGIDIRSELVLRSDFEDLLDKDDHEWFLVRGWRPARFFYVDRRIKMILSLIREQEAKIGEADRLNAQAEEVLKFADDDPQARSEAAEFQRQAKDIRYYINRDIRNAGITKDEESFVKANRYLLEDFADK